MDVDDEDAILLRVMEESLRHYNEVEVPMRMKIPVLEVTNLADSKANKSSPEDVSTAAPKRPTTITASGLNSTNQQLLKRTNEPTIGASRVDVPAIRSNAQIFTSSELTGGPSRSSDSMPGSSRTNKPIIESSRSTGAIADSSGPSESIAESSKLSDTFAGSSRINEQKAGSSRLTDPIAGSSRSTDPKIFQTNKLNNSITDIFKPSKPTAGSSNQRVKTLTSYFNQATTTKDNEQNGPGDILTLTSDGKTLTKEGFCSFTGRHWVYPTNYPERKYQLDMVQTALFHNTLVCLPTGLGKTFIAAVVMYNFYRWYPKGKIIFMAPTKPLVAQQINACYDITGIPKAETEEMTGVAHAERRTLAWIKKRVFFATPQVVANDLVSQICPAEDIRCLVVDEAHRAQGNYAYCQVVATLRAYNQNFRLLALSATPGSDINAVKQVLTNLQISKLKIATEDSPDVAQYTHKRQVEVVKVSSTPELNEAKERFLLVMDKYLKPLVQNNIVNGYNIANLTQFQMKTNLDRLAKNPPGWFSSAEFSKMQSLCIVSITLCHALELLQNYGLKSFLSYIQGTLQSATTNKVVVGYLSKDENLISMIEDLNERLGNKPIKNETNIGSKIKFGHPKLQKLQEIVLHHFLDHEDDDEKTRVIVFCQYRDSVEEIFNVLSEVQPYVLPKAFIGQAKSKASGGLTQKQQIEVMKDFRSGKFNTLISTCVGEEGLDIGEVDLIVCVDASKSPIRLVQRMGRTGRKRAGKIIMLLSDGREYKKYIDSTKQQSSISKAILNTQKLLPILNQMLSPRMIPTGLVPKIYRSVLVIPRENKEQDIRKALRKNVPANDFESALLSSTDIAKWDGEIPEFKCLSNMYTKKFTVFEPLGNVVSSSEELGKPVNDDVLPVDKWLEWQRSPQGSYEASHSKDTLIITGVLTLAERLTSNYAEALTQTSELVSKVDHDALWNTLKGKGRGKKTSKGRGNKGSPGAQPVTKRGDIAWMLQQQGQKTPASSEPFSAEDAEVFVIPDAPPPKQPEKPQSIVTPEITEAINKLSLETKPEPGNPFCKAMALINVVQEAVSKVKNKYLKPDLSLVPPDISSLNNIFEELKVSSEPATLNITSSSKSPVINKRKLSAEPEIFELIDNSDDSNDGMIISQTTKLPVMNKRKLSIEPEIIELDNSNDSIDDMVISQTAAKSPVIGKRKLSVSQETTDNKIHTLSHPLPSLFKESLVNKLIMNTNITVTLRDSNIVSPVKTNLIKKQESKRTSADHEISQGMNDFLMNFDIGLDDDCLEIENKMPEENVQKNIKEEIPTISEKIDQNIKIDSKITLSIQLSDEMKKGNEKTKEDSLNFNILDDDDDYLFADVDLSSWAGEVQKLQAESQSLKQKTPEKIHKELPISTCSLKTKSSLFSSSNEPISDITDRCSLIQENKNNLPLSASIKLSEIDAKNKLSLETANKHGLTPSKSLSERKLLSKNTPNGIKPLNNHLKSPDIFASDFEYSPIGPTLNRTATNIVPKSSPIITKNVRPNNPSPDMFKSTSNSSSPQPSSCSTVSSPLHPSSTTPPIQQRFEKSAEKVHTKLSMKNLPKNKPIERLKAPDIEVPTVHNISTTSEDDSLVYVPRKSTDKRQGVIISSDESSPEGKTIKKVKVIEEERFQNYRKDSNGAIEISSEEEEEEEEEMSAANTTWAEAVQDSDSDVEFVQSAGKRKSNKAHNKKPKKKTRKAANDFLDVEAEVSGEIESGDEDESSQMDKYDESFINNGTETQADPSIDMRAQYLRSVRSPIHAGKYKIPALKPAMNVISQAVNDDDDDEYMNDSFCVDGEAEREDESQGSNPCELEELEARLKQRKRKKKRKRGDRMSSDEEENKKRVKSKKMRRIITHAISSSDEDEMKQAASLEITSPPQFATSTPNPNSKAVATSTLNTNIVKGFEGDYVDDDAELEELMACISATQEAEMIQQQTKKHISRSLFAEEKSTSSKCEQSSSIIKNTVPCLNRNVPTGSRSTNIVPSSHINISASSQSVNIIPSTSRDDMLASVPRNKGIPTESCNTKNIPSTMSSKLTLKDPVPYSSKDVYKGIARESRNTINAPSTMSSKTTLKDPVPSSSKDVDYNRKPRLSDPSDFNEDILNAVIPGKTVLSLPKAAEASTSRGQLQVPIAEPREQIQNVPNTVIKQPTIVDKHTQNIRSSVATARKQPVAETPIIIASSSQIVSGPNVITVLRTLHKINVIMRTLPQGIDYVLSHRLAVGRVPIQDVESVSSHSKLVASVRALRHQFRYVVLVIENHNTHRPVTDAKAKPWEHQRISQPGIKHLRTILHHLHKVDGLKVVFSRDQAQTAATLQKLAVKENQSKFGIINCSKQSSYTAFDIRVKFYSSLPGVNIALAFKLVHQYPVLTDFIKKCSSVDNIEKLLQIDRRSAAAMYQVLYRRLQ